MKKYAAQPHSFERRFFIVLVSVAVFLFGLYIFFVSSSIVNVLVREEIELEIAQLHSQIGEIESTYIVQKDAISLDLAYSLGFIDATSKIFITRKTLSKVGLTLNQ